MAIVKAGITKFFQNGKNKILLELIDVKGLPDEILRELAMLDLMARELSGRIIILTADVHIKTKVEHFATPPVVPCVATREEAFKAFAPKTDGIDGKSAAKVAAQAAAVPVAPSPTPAVAASASATPPATGASDKEGLFKEQLKQREITELGPLRKQVAELENENKLIKDQLHAMIMARRSVAEPKALEEKIVSLEQQLADLVAQSQSAPKKA